MGEEKDGQENISENNLKTPAYKTYNSIDLSIKDK